MKEGKLISCVPKGKGKNGPNLSCFSILPDPSVSVPLDPACFPLNGLVTVTAMLVPDLGYVLQVTVFPGESWRTKLNFWLPPCTLSATPAAGYLLRLVWDPCCPSSLEQNLLLLGPFFPERLSFHDCPYKTLT